ncbi:MAG: M48 family metallopeptidase [Phycisphaerae bacterium]|jgi:predicted Zn-dependent protease
MTTPAQRFRPAAILVAAAAAMATLGGCETNPATGKSQFLITNRDQEIAMGDQASPQLINEMGGELNDPQVRAYVVEVGRKLAATTEADNPTLPWSFTVVDSDIINAFALPGGRVFISRGLLRRMTNEAQLAGVLGHEVGHVTARHINDRMVNTAIAGIGVSVAGSILTEGVGGPVGDIAPKALELGGQTIVLRYGRRQELEADALGMRYMTRANYNPMAQRQVMEILEQSMGTEAGSEWFSTHPYPKTRIEQIDRLLATEYAGMVRDPAFQLKAEEFTRRCRGRLALGRPAPLTDQGEALTGLPPASVWCATCRHDSHVATR